MSDMRISAISGYEPSLDLYSIHKVLISDKISDYDKMRFLHKNQMQINHIMETKISSNEFINMMQGRALIRFRPLKNSYTKWGDKILLAKTLGILPSQVSDYVKNVSEAMSDVSEMGKLPMDKIDSVKTYVYRHGTKSEVVAVLDYELKHTKDFIKTLQNTLEYGNGGLADYFVRPIHRMTNKSMFNLYNVLSENINFATANGVITEEQKSKLTEYALVRIYAIHHNNRLINAIKNDIK